MLEVALILSIRKLLALRGSPGVTRNLDGQPTLFVVIRFSADNPLVKFKPPKFGWQAVHFVLKIARISAASVLFVPATPKTVDARVVLPDLIANVT